MSQPALHGTACIVCRRRGRKCDRTLPLCLNCGKRGVTCEGYVTRWPGVAARGKLAGKATPVLDDCGPAPAPRSKGLKVMHGPKHLKKAATTGSEILSGHSSQQTREYWGKSDQFDETDIDNLVGHYIQDLSGIFYLGSGPRENPMFTYVLPLVNTVPPIRYALAASTACHTAARTSDDALNQKSLSLRVHATRLLREMLGGSVRPEYETMLPSVLMMAQLDMCSGDCTEFETHMQAGVAICRDSASRHASNHYYFEQRLAWLDIISSTTSDRLPFFTVAELKVALNRHPTNAVRGWGYDVFPCPVDLCEMMVDAMTLFKTQTSNTIELCEETAERAKRIVRQLQDWDGVRREPTEPRRHLVQAWRLGIMTYLARLFPSAVQNSIPVPSSKAIEVIEHARSIQLATSFSYPLLWPLFQAAVSLKSSAVEEETWIRRYLTKSLEAVGCRHFSNALDTLDFVWANRGRLPFSSTGAYGRTIMLG